MLTTEIPAGATVYTDRLRGATLDELLDAAERHRFPALELSSEWDLLRAWAIAVDSWMEDQAENEAWEQQMLELAYRHLPYTEWVAERVAALKKREKSRKLAQDRLRHRYGFKRARRRGLIARDVVRCFRRWIGDAS